MLAGLTLLLVMANGGATQRAGLWSGRRICARWCYAIGGSAASFAISTGSIGSGRGKAKTRERK